MPKDTGRKNVVSKDVVLDEPCDPWFEIMGNIKGKVEQVKILDLDLKYQVLFP
jgi:hypothetical protein